jgi:hypothetical protein
MKKKSEKKKLELSKETLQRLNEPGLHNVVAGVRPAPTEDKHCGSAGLCGSAVTC